MRKVSKEITVKYGETEITINNQAISVSAPKIEINQESDKSNRQS